MENNEEKKSITIRQGSGDDAMEMTVLVSQEELDKMEQIRRFSPENWEGRDLELLQEARKIISETPVTIKIPKEECTESVPSESEIDKETPKHNNSGLWWTLGVLCFIFIGSKVFSYIVHEKTKDTFSAYTQRNKIKQISYKGLTFDYPGNWSFSGYELSDDIYSIAGQNEKRSELAVMWTTNTEANSTDFIDNIITGYESSGQFEDVEYSAVYDVDYNHHKALEVDYSYVYKGEKCFSKVITFVIDGKTIILNPIVRSEKELDGEELQLIGKSIKFIE